MNPSNAGTIRYLERHTLFRTLGHILGGAMRVLGLVVLGLVGAAVWVGVRWPTVTLVVLLVLWWRRRMRRGARVRLAKEAARAVEGRREERERLSLDLGRARVLAALARVDPDVVAAERDYREGRISRHDYDTALSYAAEQARERAPSAGGRFRFQH